jgi:hypothetical protein
MKKAMSRTTKRRSVIVLIFPIAILCYALKGAFEVLRTSGKTAKLEWKSFVSDIKQAWESDEDYLMRCEKHGGKSYAEYVRRNLEVHR